MKRWVKVTLGVAAGLVVLLVLNAIVVSNETADAERNVEGAELVETSSGTIQVVDEGTGTGSPIVLIHGYTASLSWFEQLAPLLAENHRVVRVDLLGHGGSDKPKTGYEITDQANAIAEALAKLGVEDATVVGHSLGASVATAVVEQSPQLATKLVNIDQAPDDGFEDLSFSAELGYQPVIGQAVKRLTDIAPTSAVRGEYQRAFAPGFNIASGFDDPDQVVEDLHEMTYTSFVDVAEAEGDYTDDRPLDDRLGALEIPVLVIFGVEDQIYDAEAAVEPYEDIPGVQTELLEGSGHSPNIEIPEVVAPLILAFADAPTPAEKQAARAAKQAAAKQAAKAAAEQKGN
ncbi:MAG: alpha/beta hydrolase [Actinomycetota bacterium]|nr:alpha/beta hydrolase [Actinomycetota bacterium]